MAQPDLSRGGIDLRLTQVPVDLGAIELKQLLHDQVNPLQNIGCDFLVILEMYAEDILWRQQFEGNLNVMNTARVCIPNVDPSVNPGGNNVGTGLVNQAIPLNRANGQQVTLRATLIQQSETTRSKYLELRQTRFKVFPLPELPNGSLGTVQSVSCGSLNSNNEFETAHTWQLDPNAAFNSISYFADLFPQRFQVCLSQAQGTRTLPWEWMDLHINNIKGIICDDSLDTTLQRRVYFVVDKAPQFYLRSSRRAKIQNQIDNGFNPNEDLPGRAVWRNGIIQKDNPDFMVYDYRTRFPTDVPSTPDLDVCSVPWIIQFSRVYAVTYTPRSPQLALSALLLQNSLSKTRQASIFAFHVNRVATSNATPQQQSDQWRANLTLIANQGPAYQLALLKLLCNCNLSATDTGSIQNINVLAQSLVANAQLADVPRAFCDLLEQSAHKMETSHKRVLRRMWPGAIQGNGRVVLPLNVAGAYMEPDRAVIAVRNSPGFVDMANRLSMLPRIYKAIAYPSHVEIYGPEAVSSNSIVEANRNNIDRFIKVRFLDNNNLPFAPEPLIWPDMIIWDRIWTILSNRHRLFPLEQQHFDFLGYSISGLKRKKMVWCFKPSNDLSITAMQNTIGNWNVQDPKNGSLARNSSKWGARMSLAYTESIAIPLGPDGPTRQVRGDVGIADMPNTDGCGLVNLELTVTINTTLSKLGYKPSSAFQIRFPGVKGVVYTGASEILLSQVIGQPAPQMLLRNSQVKYTPGIRTSNTLRIVSTAGDGQSVLFMQSLLKALEDLAGANAPALQQTVVNIYTQAYDALSPPSAAGLDLLQQILNISEDERQVGFKSRDALLKLAIRLCAPANNIPPDSYRQSFLELYLSELAKSARNKDMFQIPIPGTHEVLGLTDDYQVLLPGNFYNSPDHPANPGQPNVGAPKPLVYIRSKGQVVAGRVLVFRDPILHLGDIQEALALDDVQLQEKINTKYGAGTRASLSVMERLQFMDNIIFFSQEDRVPFPNRLSGGDLDGDRFNIIPIGSGLWFPNFQALDPVAYPPAGNPPESRPWSMDDLSAFLCKYIRNDCFAELQNTLMCVADQRVNGMFDADVQALAGHISQAVDFLKSGIPADLALLADTAAYQIKARPDFLRALNWGAFYDAGGEYYQSQKLLGTVYRSVKAQIALQDRNPNQPNAANINNQNLVNTISARWRVITPVIDRWDTRQDAIIAALRQWLSGDIGQNNGQIQNYCDYLNGRAVPATSEMDIFMRRPLDDFPEGPISAITAQVLQILAIQDIIEACPPVMLGFSYQNVQAVNIDQAKIAYMKSLWIVWDLALQLTGNRRGTNPAGFGQSYAFICLYMLYCQTPPIAARPPPG